MISQALEALYHLVWGVPLLVLLVAVGLYLTWMLNGVQFRYLGAGLRMIFRPPAEDVDHGEGDVSHFQSLMTALAASLGIGNIAGMATAITVGGVGALFWLWIVAIIGMATKFTEAFLAVKYRITDHRGEMCGGPMYFIDRGLGSKWKWLAVAFAIFGALSALGGGNMIQANSVGDIFFAQFGVNPWITGGVMAVLTLATLLGGIKSIGRFAGIIVPFMALFYLFGGMLILAMSISKVPTALLFILKSAFTGQAATGGFAGASVAIALRSGVARSLMCSEAGLGAGSIAAAAAKTHDPGHQGLISMAGSFLGSVCMCSITGLVLVVTGVLGETGADGRLLNGAPMTVHAFDSVIPGSGWVVMIGLVLFAYTTILGWAYYGEKCLEYLIGEGAVLPFRVLFSLVIIPGAVLDLHVVWTIADIANGLMAFPNVLAILIMAKLVRHEALDYLARLDGKQLKPALAAS